MSNNKKIELQREQITSFMNYFKDHRLDFNDTELLKKMQNAITRVFQLEIEELGYSYNPNRDDSENTFRIKIY